HYAVGLAVAIATSRADAQQGLRRVSDEDLDHFAGRPRAAARPGPRPAKVTPHRTSSAAPTRTATASLDLTAIAYQAALDRAGFSPGLIDGVLGPKTTLALEEFQEARGLPASGTFD